MRDALQNLMIRAVLGAVLAVPYRARVPMMGWIVSRVVAPLAGWHKRIRANLAHVLPDLPEAEVRRLIRAVPDNAGRTLIEIYSGAEFADRVKDTPLTGPGLAALKQARASRIPTILVTGHFGNYDAPRAALAHQGFPLGALYREMKNRRFNDHYVQAISRIAQPVFPATRKGLGGFVGHLRDGNSIGILIDIYAGDGRALSYFGQPAPTAISTAEWALKFGAVVIPIYGVRRADGLSFDIVLDTPIPHSDAATMTQALNDSLESMVRQHMEQWFWIHRRWKPERQSGAAPRACRP